MTDNQSIELASAPSVERLVELDNDQLGEMLTASARSEAEHASLQGAILREAKVRLRRGEWSPWLKRYWPKSERTARVYMQLNASTMLDSGRASAVISGTSIKKALPSSKPPVLPQPEVVDDWQRFLAEFERMWQLDERRVRLWLRARFQPAQPSPGLRSVRSEPGPPQVEPLPAIEHSTAYWQQNGRQAQPKKVRDAPVTRRRGSGL